MGQSKVVILDKSQRRREYLRTLVSNWGHLTFIFEKAAICLDNLRPLGPDLIISGPLSHDRMDRFVNTIKMMDGDMPVLIISSDPSLNDFAAYDGFKDVKVLKKNFESIEIQAAINQLLHHKFFSANINKPPRPVIIGNSPEILKIKKKITESSRLDEPVLIQGEPGTGKELVARAVHHQSQRCNSPFVKVNLAEINSDQLDEFIFGVEQKSFLKSSPGFVEPGNPSGSGTLFLEDITALPPLLQSRLLTVYEQSSFMAGSLKKVGSNAAAMNMVVTSSGLLDDLVSRGKFRKDLYYRMRVFSIDMPPLRKRVADIAPLTEFFTDQLCMEYDMGHMELPPEIMDCLYRYPWPGNVRELKNVVRRMVLYGDSDGLIQNLLVKWAKSQVSDNSDQGTDQLTHFSNIRKYLRDRKNMSLKNVCAGYVMATEKAMIKKALALTNWNRKKAAGLLDISYKSLLNKIKLYRLG